MSTRTRRNLMAFVTVVAVAAIVPMTAEAGHRGRDSGRGWRSGTSYRGSPYRGYSPYRHRSGFGLGISFGGYYRHSPWWPSYRVAYEPWYVPVYRNPYPAEYRSPGEGKIETDVKPSSAAVWLDGRPVGLAGDFDGWPGKLPAEAGTHELLFREIGYQPLRVVVDVLPRHTVKIEQRMVAGDDQVDDATEPPAAVRPQAPPPADTSPEAPPAVRREGRGTLELEVSPASARVFVDGRRQGDGSTTPSYILELPQGSHQVEVVQSGYDTFSGEIVLGPRQRQSLSVRLKPVGGG